LIVSKDELFIRHLHDFVIGDILIFFFLHNQVKISVVDENGCLLLHDDVLLKRINERDSNLKLVYFFKPVLVVAVNLVDGEFVLSQCINLVVLTQLNLLDVPCNVILADLLGAEVKYSNLRIRLSSLSEEIIHLNLFSFLESNDSFEGIKLDGVILVGISDLSFFAFLFLILA